MLRILRMKKVLLFIAIAIITLSVLAQRNIVPGLNKYFNSSKGSSLLPQSLAPQTQTVVYEESVVTKVVEDSLPSVVTIGIRKTTSGQKAFEIDPFDPFSPFKQTPQEERNIEQNIGSGFIISKDGLVITNKHVVLDTDAEYQVLTHDKKKYDVEKIYRDPLNDLAILKINASSLKPLKIGNSNNMKLGQIAIAIGTPLGEFQNTITQGIISGIGRGITAGSPFEGFVEKLDNVIQTDAAISPGNSGGPLLNSRGEAVGVNTAVASQGQNIGFAIPINVVTQLIQTFQRQGGRFERPYIGVRYQMVDQKTAILNKIVEGAYVEEVVKDSPADRAGMQQEDIIVEFDGKKVKGDDDQGLAKQIMEKKIDETVQVKIWRDGETKDVSLTLEGYSQ